MLGNCVSTEENGFGVRDETAISFTLIAGVPDSQYPLVGLKQAYDLDGLKTNLCLKWSTLPIRELDFKGRIMSLITEIGTGATDSESYISVADTDLYHSNLGNTLWATMSTGEKEQALRRATSFMIGRYRTRWLGRRVLTTQALDWPRVGVVLQDFGGAMRSYGLFQVDYSIVPNEVKNACAELAFRAASGPLVEDLTKTVTEETVGPITVKYDPNSPQLVRYQQVDEMLGVYLTSGGTSSMVKLTRC